MSEATAPTRVGIFVFDEVEVLDCCGPFEVFSVANRVNSLRNGTLPFVLSLIAKTPEVSARGGLALRAHQIIDQDPEVDLLLVSGGVTGAVERDRATISWLSRSQAQVKASICTGAFLLAEAGILTDQRVTTHWEDQSALSARWPSLRVERDRRWVCDGNVFSSGGISAGIDLSLHLVEVTAGRDLAIATAKQMEYTWVEDAYAPGVR
ncbi:DJ-1/PfpI family protein [Arthrobacter sp. ov118]|uniref:DJ-1/PfpI family protein n=1 Tax=Arthrobacter sp. ov118 TaxID=1761747 RepID=UPI0008E45938|nr:DJ-1/PfpI family protein [Arthrobacter sp. ov118]SFT92416.1 DJ-1/PfpI family protein [Arthrobacter sp. ov118]